MIERAKPYTICVDFDGVIHSYTSPFTDKDTITDPPVPGAFDWLTEMVRRFNVVIHTTRASSIHFPASARRWFREYGMPQAVWEQFIFTHLKCPALIYIDDRAYRFTGANFPTAHEIHTALPWNKVREEA